VRLGEVTSFDTLFIGKGERWLQVNEKDKPPIGERIQITSVAHALKVNSANALDAPGGDPAVVMDNNGKVGIGTTSPSQNLEVAGCVVAQNVSCPSSRRWKTDIQPIPDALEKIRQLRGVSYVWKEDGKHNIGLIAEEVAEVIPEVISFEDNGKDARAIDYSRLVAVLIEAVKEQQNKIAALEGRLKAVEAMPK